MLLNFKIKGVKGTYQLQCNLRNGLDFFDHFVSGQKNIIETLYFNNTIEETNSYSFQKF